MGVVDACKKVDRFFTHRPADHWIGYLVAISGALMQMMSYGIDNSFSIFSKSMQQDPTLGYPTATTVSFGNSVSLGLSPIFGVFAGFLVDRVPPRIMMFISTVMLFAGLWLSSSFAKSSAQVTGSYCLLASISSAFMLSPGAAATSSWFRRRLGLGQGINFCGGGIGSAVVPAVLGKLVDVYGWRHTFRLMSAFCSIGLVGTILSCRRHPIEDDVDVEANARLSSGETASSEEERDRARRVHADPNREPTSDGAEEPTRGMQDRRRGGDQNLDEEMADAMLFTNLVPTAGEKAKTLQPGQAATSPNSTNCGGELGADNGAALGSAAGAAAPAAVADGRARSCTLAELMEDMHTRKLVPREVLRVVLSPRFMTHFFMFAIFGWCFYGLIYITGVYVPAIGDNTTVYAEFPKIGDAKSATIFTFWGVFQIIGSVFIGAMASFTADAFAYTACAAVGGVACGVLAFCRSYADFAACMSIIGFCTAGLFAMMPALIAKDFHGPNLGFFMGSVFVAGCLGGFSAPPIQAQLATRYHGNYSYGCVFISCSMTFPGVMCYLLLWPEKQSRIGRLFKRVVKEA